MSEETQNEIALQSRYLAFWREVEDLTFAKQKANRLHNLIWEISPQKNGWKDVTPEAMLEKLGTAATDLFQKYGALVAFIKSIDAEWEPMQPKNELIYNQDGSITLGKKIDT